MSHAAHNIANARLSPPLKTTGGRTARSATRKITGESTCWENEYRSMERRDGNTINVRNDNSGNNVDLDQL